MSTEATRVPEPNASEEPGSRTRRRLIALGGAAAGAAVVSGLGAGAARADDCDGLDVVKKSPLNARLPQFADGLDPDDPEEMGSALAAAIDFAVEEEEEEIAVVLAPAGTYEVHDLEIPEGMHLIGEGPATVLTCPGPNSTAVKLTGDGATLSNLRIEGDQTGSIGSGDEGAVSVEAAHCAVRAVEIVDARKAGILLNGAAGSARIAGCRVENPSTYCILGWLDDDEAEVGGVSISRNDLVADSPGAGGVMLKRENNGDESVWVAPRIRGNSIAVSPDSNEPAISLGNIFQSGSVSGAVISANSVAGGTIGLFASDATGTTAVGNTFVDAATFGIGIIVLGAGSGGHDVIVGNTIEGRSDVVSEGGITIIGVDEAAGTVINGNTVKGCRSGIAHYGSLACATTGNFVEATDDTDAYDLGISGTEDSTGWAGISVVPFSQASAKASVVGNQVDGSNALPIGIKLHDAALATANGNLVRGCIPDGSDPPRDILIRVTDEGMVDEGLATAGAVVANQAHVSVSTGNGGAVGDLRVSANRLAELPEVEADTDLVLVGLPEIVSVGGTPTTHVENVFNFNAGSSPTALSYPGRRVTLRFTEAIVMENGTGNLRLDDDFPAVDGSTLALISDGAIWHEVSRTL